jgi:hypothetical protein
VLTQPQLQVGCTDSTLVTSSYSDSACHLHSYGPPACSRPLSVIQHIYWSITFENPFYTLQRLHYVFIELCSDSRACAGARAPIVMLGVNVAGGAQDSGCSRCLSSGSCNRTHLRNTSPTPNTGILDTHRPTTRNMLLGEIFVYWGHAKHTLHSGGKVQNFVMLKQLVKCGYHCAVEKWINPIFVILCLSVQITHMMRRWRYSKPC